MKKLLTALLVLAMAFTMVFATAASAEDGYKDSITWVIGNDQDILDPQNNVSNSKVIPQYYNGLLGYDNDGNVVCKIAESYEASEDKMTWTFHLRQDVYFHSGRHCTAHDFEATFDRLLNTENPQRYTSNASFIGSAVAKIPMEKVVKATLPFYLCMIITLLLVTFVPAISMFIPNLLK